MKVQGQISHVSPLEFVGKNQLAKRSLRLVMSTSQDGQYEQAMGIDLIGDNANEIDESNVGDTADFTLNYSCTKPEAREDGRMFTNIKAWKIDIQKSTDTEEGSDEDLPF